MPSDALRIMAEAAEPVGEPATAPEPLPLTAAELARELLASLKTLRRMDQSGRLLRSMNVGYPKRSPREIALRRLKAGAPRRTVWERFHQ